MVHDETSADEGDAPPPTAAFLLDRVTQRDEMELESEYRNPTSRGRKALQLQSRDLDTGVQNYFKVGFLDLSLPPSQLFPPARSSAGGEANSNSRCSVRARARTPRVRVRRHGRVQHTAERACFALLARRGLSTAVRTRACPARARFAWRHFRAWDLAPGC